MKKTILSISLLLAALALPACDEESSSGTDNHTSDDKSFSALCVNSGGVFKTDRCVCDGVTCEDGDLCNTRTKACPAHGDTEQFKRACTESGGSPDGNVCTCDGEKCAAYQVCSNNKCPKSSDHEGPTDYTTCINDDDSVGWLNQCHGVDCEKTKCEIDVDGTKIPVSCHGNQCGSCLNNTNTCENDAENNNAGVLYTCREGQKIKSRLCRDNHSCLVKSCDDNTCIDEFLCGECVEGDFKCENGNVPADTNLIKYDGSSITVPQGFITGLRSKCIGGLWNKLELDDPENCYFGNQEFNAFHPENNPNIPHTELNGRTVVTVFGYDSRGKTTGNEYFLSMCAADGKSCGECMYSFSYCSDNTILTCKDGRVEKSQCPSLDSTQGMCATGNACFPPSTAAYCAADSCQNCKSICNW